MQALFQQAPVSCIGASSFLESACCDHQVLIAKVRPCGKKHGISLLDQSVAVFAHGVLSPSGFANLREFFFGGYRILRVVLGEGGMGVVYLAERKDLFWEAKSLSRFCAIPGYPPPGRERFASEQCMLAQLTHPSIARLYDADTLPDGTPWFAMEHVDGIPLSAVLLGGIVVAGSTTG